ncbi:sulfurtransferase TusA family protein [Bacillus sp. ISL-47]|uniref:sulfurtransferase TusA family protein n=1 Tax=Bacillus sp. ISL-47 TaxID=2819130 RepID=UPI001BE6C240|nr:sulfurtransferase TusA family protein [Bacillus sp. ISL-47]MBT2689720.1 sulfurtransferase TusA family protein [Bacillus sp. ISL-47]MBT2709974.1 sulfurtransferase TusA family protein [Pseudomonas sp. ISL-84]
MSITANKVLDAKGLACPMPIVKTKKMMNEIEPGQVMEIQATDKGSTADLKAWSESTGNQYLGTIEDGDVLKHYVRKASASEESNETSHPNIASLDDLLKKIEGDEQIKILDVRESAEYAFGHIPNAVSIPLGELEERFSELNPEEELHVICRSGSRSDLAAKKLTEKGFKNVVNVVPGMKDWTGPTQKL